MNYNYEFLYRMKCRLALLRSAARSESELEAENITDALLFYLCGEESSGYLEIIRGMKGSADEEEPELFDGWLYAMPDTLDAIAFLYSDLYLEASNPFHFDHWNEQPHAEAPLRKAECTLYLYTIRVIDVFSSFID